MTAPTVTPGLNTYRMTSLAWCLAVDKIMTALRHEPEVDFEKYSSSAAAQALSELDEMTVAERSNELITAGVTDAAGTVRPEWMLAVWQAASAPIKVGAVSRTGEVSTHCEVSLFEGRGLAVEFSRQVQTAANGSISVTGINNVSTITFFSAEDLWTVVAKSLPQLSELTSTGQDSPPGSGPATVTLSADTAAALARGNVTDAPDDVAAAIAHARATVHITLEADSPHTPQRYLTANVWTMARKLYSIRTAGPDTARQLVMVEGPPGHIAHQLVWDVLGAHDFLAKAAAASAAGQA